MEHKVQQLVLKLVTAQIQLRALEACELPSWSGSLLRGLVGRSLRRIVCTLRSRKTCQGCPLVANCVYPSIYEYAEHTQASTGSYAPAQPYVLSTTLGQVPKLVEGDVVDFAVTLLGPAHIFLPHLVCAIEDVASVGIGRNRKTQGRFMLEAVVVNGVDVYDAQCQALREVPAPDELILTSVPKQLEAPCEEYVLKLVTPLRVKQDNKLHSSLSCEQFFNIVFRRIVSVWGQFGDLDAEFKQGELLSFVRTIDWLPLDERWLDLHRFSSRQESTMKLGGIVGSYLLKGGVRPLLPYLRIVERLHIGKQTTFGLGKISVTRNGEGNYEC